MTPRSKARPAVVKLSGDLDVYFKAKLQAELLAIAEGSVLIIDLSDVNFIDSAGLTVLIDAHKRITRSGGEVRIVAGEDQQVYRILQITGLTRLFRMFATQSAAAAG